MLVLHKLKQLAFEQNKTLATGKDSSTHIHKSTQKVGAFNVPQIVWHQCEETNEKGEHQTPRHCSGIQG